MQASGSMSLILARPLVAGTSLGPVDAESADAAKQKSKLLLSVCDSQRED